MHLLRAMLGGNEPHLPELWRRTRAPAAALQTGMNYRHAFHAGNFADVHKHLALVAILRHLARKAAPFAVVDTHAGRALYDLGWEEAVRTGEAAAGIGKLRDHVAHSQLLADYLALVRDFGPAKYPGSPLIATRLLRPQDRLVAIEKHPEDFAGLRQALTPFRNARAIEADGYLSLTRQLPPQERRGLVLIDPPYEDVDEFERLGSTVADATRKFATGIFLLWYPLKLASRVDALSGELLAAGVTDLMRLTIDVGRPPDVGEQLSAAGLLLVNPPYQFDVEMRAASDEILPLLARGPGAQSAVEWLRGPS
ncbi:MAG TPA: 23S rRNA (adenine(2030)-N(6))-methyltransferase RlmJ [Rhizomicrobium sp.]|nr:23S rRNA (adenine(2030)-N(6))-methyltransferase RlmJ [Rhizomicrobium sp.]